ncbi:MAG: hypothetical protein V4512_13430 [Pseudomonadota bacterium]
MDGLLTIFNMIQMVIITYFLIKFRSFKKQLGQSEGDLERMNAQCRLLENNARHSETFLKAYKDSNKLTVAFFTEELSESNYFNKRIRLRYKSQIYLNGLPIGSASTLKEDIISSIDREKVDNILEKYALPLLEAGISVANLAHSGQIKAGQTLASNLLSKGIRRN